MTPGATAPAGRFGGRFDILEEVGAGGAASVFRARDRQTSTDVALKVLHSGPGLSVDRFDQEANLLASLNHPAIVRYLDHGVTSDGEAYMALEWLEGETLEQRLQRGPVTVADTLAFAVRVLDGLALAHRRGIVHRDLKPSNLFLPAGALAQVKLLDFGVARRVVDVRRMTRTGMTVGTPMYMAPEQARAELDVDARADVFSLGCVLYECLTAQPAFTGATAVAVLAKICLDDAVDVARRCPSLPGELSALLTSMLAKDRTVRPADAGVLLRPFTELAARYGQPGTARRRRTRQVTVTGDKPITLTTNEARLFAVILAVSADGRVPDDVALDRARRALSSYGARIDPLFDGSLIVTLQDRGAALDRILDAARTALALRTCLPDAALVIASARVSSGSVHDGVPVKELPVAGVLESAAVLLAGLPPGSIAVDEGTGRVLEYRFELSPVEGSRRLLLYEKGLREPPRTLLGRPVPYVGRERELADLEGLWAEATHEPVARAVLVTSPPGGGKSRLQHELLARLQRTPKPFTLLAARGEVWRRRSPFALLGPALRSLAHLDSELSNQGAGVATPAARERFTRRFGRHLRPEVAARILPFLGELAGVDFPDTASAELRAARRDARMMADRTLSAWLDWLDAETIAGPVLLMLDDLQWGDAPSVDFIDAALRTLHDRPLMVLAFARPEVDDAFASLWSERELQRIALPPLGAKACAKLIEQTLVGVTGERLAWIVERSEGNPFFLEELVRVFGGSARPDAGALPETVLGMLQARFDALGDEAKRVLRAASIFGEKFPAAGLEALLAGGTFAGIDEWLDLLGAREIIFPVGVRASRVFAFRHALLREAAYSLLTEEDRRIGHQLAGRFLESVNERDANLLVEHFTRGDALDRAAYWSRFAAEQALEANDLAAALARVERGVLCGAADATLGHLRLTESKARYWCGEYERGFEAALEAAALLPDVPRLDAWASAAVSSGHLARFSETTRYVELIRDFAPPDEPAAHARAASLMRAAAALIPSGAYEAIERVLTEIGAPAALPLEVLQMQAYNLRAFYDAHRGALAESVAGFSAGAAVADAAGDARLAAEMRGNAAVTLAELGVYAEAEPAMRRALAQAERLGVQHVVTALIANLTWVLGSRGRFEEARTFGRRALELARKQGDARMFGSAALYLALVDLQTGHPEAAEGHARVAVDTCRLAPASLPPALAALARALINQGRVSEALEYAGDAYRLLEQLGHVEQREELVRFAYALALARAARGDEARVVIRRARQRIAERLACISKAEWHDRFASIPEIHETLALGRALGIVEPLTETPATRP